MRLLSLVSYPPTASQSKLSLYLMISGQFKLSTLKYNDKLIFNVGNLFFEKML